MVETEADHLRPPADRRPSTRRFLPEYSAGILGCLAKGRRLRGLRSTPQPCLRAPAVPVTQRFLTGRARKYDRATRVRTRRRRNSQSKEGLPAFHDPRATAWLSKVPKCQRAL